MSTTQILVNIIPKNSMFTKPKREERKDDEGEAEEPMQIRMFRC